MRVSSGFKAASLADSEKMSQMEPMEDRNSVLVARGQYWIGNRYMVTLIERGVRASWGLGVRTGMSFPARASLLYVLVRARRATQSTSVLFLYLNHSLQPRPIGSDDHINIDG